MNASGVYPKPFLREEKLRKWIAFPSSLGNSCHHFQRLLLLSIMFQNRYVGHTEQQRWLGNQGELSLPAPAILCAAGKKSAIKGLIKFCYDTYKMLRRITESTAAWTQRKMIAARQPGTNSFHQQKSLTKNVRP